MLKKSAFSFFIFALLLGSSNLFAQKPLREFSAPGQMFSVAPPKGGVVKLEGELDLGLRNAAELTDQERQEKDAFSCYACTGLNLSGTCYRIAVGTYINANQQIPPVAGFRSFVTGGTRTFVSTCNDLNGVAPCQAFAFDSAVWGNHTGINSNLLLQSVGCI